MTTPTPLTRRSGLRLPDARPAAAPIGEVRCVALHPATGTHRQWFGCDLRGGHSGDHMAIAPNCNAPRGFQVVKRWPQVPNPK